MSAPVFTPFTLPNGNVIKNRIAKAAMEENLATTKQHPGQQIFTLYQAWSEGGCGLIITGNVMVDSLAMTGPGGIALEKDTDLAPFKQWATCAKQNNTRVWMQINHPGRQVFANMGGKALAPSDIALDMGKHSHMFAQPQAMTQLQIEDVIERFTTTASRAQQAGFDGVEIHAAHGYLFSQFLSPLTNKRQDQWGGSLENRARILIDTVTAIRQTCGRDFDVAIKLNSADFQRGGFDIDDAKAVINMLEPLRVDMVELSGGSYESPAMQGQTQDKRTLDREAYFVTFAKEIATATNMPLMTTGGIKRLGVCNDVIGQGIDMVGMASALAYTPDLPNQWQQSPSRMGIIPNVAWSNKTAKAMATMAMVKRQLRRIANNKPTKSEISPLWTLISDQIRKAKLTKSYKKNKSID